MAGVELFEKGLNPFLCSKLRREASLERLALFDETNVRKCLSGNLKEVFDRLLIGPGHIWNFWDISQRILSQ